jgi:hypothetical protein
VGGIPLSTKKPALLKRDKSTCKYCRGGGERDFTLAFFPAFCYKVCYAKQSNGPLKGNRRIAAIDIFDFIDGMFSPPLEEIPCFFLYKGRVGQVVG